MGKFLTTVEDPPPDNPYGPYTVYYGLDIYLGRFGACLALTFITSGDG